MRLRRRFGRNASLILLLAICCVVSGYFGYTFIFGERGIVAWRETQDRLRIAQHDLADLRVKREALAHRIALLDGKAILCAAVTKFSTGAARGAVVAE